MPDAVRRRRRLTVRLSGDLREHVAERAERAERSQSEVIEGIVEWARDLENEHGGPEVLALGLSVWRAFLHAGGTASAFKHGDPQPPQQWLRDPWTFDKAAAAAWGVLNGLRPVGDIEPPPLPRRETIKDPDQRVLGDNTHRVLGDQIPGGIAYKELEEIGPLVPGRKVKRNGLRWPEAMMRWALASLPML